MKPTSQVFIIIHSVLAGLQVLNGAALVTDLFGEKTGGIIALIVAVVQASYAAYNQAVQVVPTSAVAAAALPSGAVVAGPAAVQDTGTAVAVTPVGAVPSD